MDILIGFAILFLVWYRKSLFGKRDGPKVSESRVVEDITDGGGSFPLEVVGEYYNAENSSLLQNRREEIRFALMTLYPESKNAYSKTAVSVWAGKDKLGHLSKEDARVYRQMHGAKRTQALGIIQGGKLLNSCWIDSTLGSGADGACEFHRGSVYNSFPISAGKTISYRDNIMKVMGGRPSRIVQVEVAQSDNGGPFMVSIEGSTIAEIDAKHADALKGESLPGRTMAVIITTPTRWTIQISSKMAPLEGKPSA